MFPHQALVRVLDTLLDSTDLAVTYRLFKNNVTVDEDSELADFTEADFGGYAAKTAVNEPEPAIVSGTSAKSTGEELVWTKTGADEPTQQIYGVYVTFTDADEATALFACFNFTPIGITTAGNEVRVKIDWWARNFDP